MTTGKSRMVRLALIALLSGVAFTWALAQRSDQPPTAKGEGTPAKKPATHKVEKKLFKIELAAKGIVEAEDSTWIVYRPHPESPFQGGPLTVRRAVEHGAKVRQGEPLVTFDTHKLDQFIRQLETDVKMLEVSIKLTEQEQAFQEKTLPLDLEGATRSKREADEDLAYFLQTGKTEAEKRAEREVHLNALNLEYAKEQLRQLEKMYKVNDLTEETEQIILKRQRQAVDSADFSYKSSLINRDLTLKTKLPRTEKSLRDGAIKQELALERTRNTSAPMLAQKKQQLAKMRFDRDKNNKNLEILRQDRAALTIAAPGDGTIYYGKFSKGQWDAGPGLASKLMPDGTVMANEVIMTLVKTGPLAVRLQIDEKDAHLFKAGLVGKVKLVFNPERKLTGKVSKVSAVPALPGKYEVHLALDTDADANLMPGMACSVKFTPYLKTEALLVPTSALFEEDDGYCVTVVDGKGKTEQRKVTVGRANGTHTEILEGLRAGDEISLERPEGRPAAATQGGKDL